MIEKPTLVVMAKAPRFGLGKQRLAAEIGRTEAWRINRALQAHTLREACDPRWRTFLCVTPDNAMRDHISVWPGDIPRMSQGAGDLGERLARALMDRRRPRRHASALAGEAPAVHNVAVIGADCPLITRTHIAAAFRALRTMPFALGPTEDGGFWLLAARRGADAARAMAPVRWSTSHAASDVRRNLKAKVAILPTLYDIDVAADLKRWRV